MNKCPEHCSKSPLYSSDSTPSDHHDVEETYGFACKNDLTVLSNKTSDSKLNMGLGVSSESEPAAIYKSDACELTVNKGRCIESSLSNQSSVPIINSQNSRIQLPLSSGHPLSSPSVAAQSSSKPNCSYRDENLPSHLVAMMSPLRSSYNFKQGSTEEKRNLSNHASVDLKNDRSFSSLPINSQGLAMSLPSLYNDGEKGICHIHYRSEKPQNSHSNVGTGAATTLHCGADNNFADSSTESESRPNSANEGSWCGMAAGLSIDDQVDIHNDSITKSSTSQINENSHSHSLINLENRGVNNSSNVISDNASTSGCGHWCSACRVRVQVEVACVPGSQRSPNGNRRGIRTLSFPKRVRHKVKLPTKDLNGTHKKKKSPWSFKLNCKLKSNKSDVEQDSPGVSGLNVGCVSCVCPGYRRHDTEPVYRSMAENSSSSNKLSVTAPMVDLSRFKAETLPIHDQEDSATIERAREMAEGVEPLPGFIPLLRENSNSVGLPWSYNSMLDLQILLESSLRLELGISNISGITYPEGFMRHISHFNSEAALFSRTVHTQVDYIHCLVPDLLAITNCGFYWGKMDRYEAERLLENKPEGTFLLRDSVQEEYLFSVSFRRYERSLHARIEQWNHKFSFDSHDPSVFASKTVCGLIEHYKDPSCCMFFEPLLTNPLARTFPFTLQHLCRALICSKSTYDGINNLELPKTLKNYLKEYHYKQRVRVRHLD